MLKIIIELHPFGNASKKEIIAEMDLWNDVSGSPQLGNYQAKSTIFPSPWNPDPEKRGGKVVGHPRSAPVWNLVAKMLHQMGYGATSSFQYYKNNNDDKLVSEVCNRADHLADVASPRRDTET
jgi:hypothetical protein